MRVRNIAVIAVLMPLTGFAAGEGVLWRSPGPESQDLYYGVGSKDRRPRGPFTFVKEDIGGSNPKYTVRGGDGVKWKIKLGPESRAETTASRLVWAAGFFTNEDYLVPELHVQGFPDHLKRRKLIEPGGVLRNARLKREPDDEEKIGTWRWRRNPFRGTREFNGLRVVMALLNNWDLKDENTAIYQGKSGRVYMVSDIGASFGATHRTWPATRSKDNYQAYRTSGFICSEHGSLVNFCTPSRPSIPNAVNPLEFFRRLKLRWIGRDIPRADAQWVGAILGRLSPQQIRDAFRAGGFSPAEIDGFSEAVETRIRELNSLQAP
jgi:hypothetical protein